MRRLAVMIVGLTLSLATSAYADNRPCEGDCSGRQKRGCAEAQANCEDNDLNGNDVTVCLPQSTCNFDQKESA